MVFIVRVILPNLTNTELMYIVKSVNNYMEIYHSIHIIFAACLQLEFITVIAAFRAFRLL